MDEIQKQPMQESVQLRFTHSEQEYLAAVRLYFRHSTEMVTRLVMIFVLLLLAPLLLNLLLDFVLPVWSVIAVSMLAGLALCRALVVDVPRRYFRGDPKFRDEYNLTFSDSGIQFKTAHVNASLAWSLYTGVIENESFYILIYGKNINSLSILPKRAFRDSAQENIFRSMLRRNIDHNLKLSDDERENKYIPTSSEPPDWR